MLNLFITLKTEYKPSNTHKMKRTIGDFKIKEMAQMLGIHDYNIKLILGIPLSVACEAKTIAEAHAECVNAPANSEKEAAAWKRWNDFYLSDLDKAETLDDVRVIRKLCPSGSPSEIKATTKEISLCTTLEGINRLKNLVRICMYSSAHKAYLKRKMELSATPRELKELYEECPEKSEIIENIGDKWFFTSLKVISSIRSYEEMEKFFYDFSPRALTQSLLKWLEVCSNAAEIQKLHRMLFNKRAPYQVFHESFLENMYSRWIDFSYTELSESKTFAEAMEAQAHTPENSKIRIGAAVNCLNFADTFDLVEEVYIYAPNNYELKMKIFKKWLFLVSTMEEAKKIYLFFSDKHPGKTCEEYAVLDKTEIMTAIIKKIAIFHGYCEISQQKLV